MTYVRESALDILRAMRRGDIQFNEDEILRILFWLSEVADIPSEES